MLYSKKNHYLNCLSVIFAGNLWVRKLVALSTKTRRRRL